MSAFSAHSSPGASPRPPRRHASARSHHSPDTTPRRAVRETSAGGIVIDVRGGIPYGAAIARRNRAHRLEWCLPKGHLEPGESAEQAALREVAEETGIHGHIIQPLTSIDYWFSSPDRRVHKIVHHYLMGYVSGTISVAHDPDHEAEAAEWIELHDMSHQLTYQNERGIVDIALELLYRDTE